MNLNTPTGLGGTSNLGANKAAYLTFDMRGFEAMLTRAEQQVFPTAISNGLSRVAAVSRQEVQKAMDLQLDRVTPYAKRGVVYEKANKDRLSALVMIAGRSWGLKNSTPPANFLTPQLFVGEHNLKSFEVRLQKYGFWLKLIGAKN